MRAHLWEEWRWVRRLKFQPRGQVSHSYGTHHRLSPHWHTCWVYKCQQGARNVCVCVCVYTCTWWSVFFMQTKCVKINILHFITHHQKYIHKLIKANKGVSCFFVWYRGKTDVERSWLTKPNQALITLHTAFTISSEGGWESKGEREKKKAGLLLVSFEQSWCPWNSEESREGKPLQLLTAHGAYRAAVLQHFDINLKALLNKTDLSL